MTSSFWAMPIFIVAFSASVLAQTAAPPPLSVQSPFAEQLAAWRMDMIHKPTPQRACFTAEYPSTTWQAVPCTAPPLVPYGPARVRRATRVGNGIDIVGQVGPFNSNLSEAIGSFEDVLGVTTETGTIGGANAFSLQLNSNRFITQMCNSAADPVNCRGWQQFVYSNIVVRRAFIQYWLIGYGSSCPAGWKYFNNEGEDDCFMNSDATPIMPTQPITNLANLSMTGRANVDGTDDLIFSTGAALHRVSGSPSVLNLRRGWEIAEFNVFGDTNNSEAVFAGSPYIVIRISMDSTNRTLPFCYAHGFTGETNNLTLATSPKTRGPGPLPSVLFAQTIAPPLPNDPCIGGVLFGARNGIVISPAMYRAYEFGFLQGNPGQGNLLTIKISAVSIPVKYEIGGLPSWLTASPASGTVDTAGQVITLKYAEGVKNFLPGKYPGTFEISNKTNGVGSINGTVLLTVRPAPNP